MKKKEREPRRGIGNALGMGAFAKTSTRPSGSQGGGTLISGTPHPRGLLPGINTYENFFFEKK